MKRIKLLSIVLAIVLLVTSAFALSACGPKQIVKTAKLVANPIKGVDETEYVFCVSKKSANAQKYLDEINKIIASTDCADLLNKYMTNTNRRADFLGELIIEDNTGDPIHIYTTVFSPYQYSGAYGNGVDGVDMYLMVKLADNLEMKPLIHDLPYTASYNNVLEGKGDILAMGVALTDKVATDFLVSSVYSKGYQQIISDKAENFDEISDLKGMVIGVITGRIGQELIQQAIDSGVLKGSGATIVEYTTDAEAYSAFTAEQCDVLVIDEYPAKVMLK